MYGTSFRNTHSSGKMDWQTPDDLFYFIENKLGKFDLDACASDENTLCSSYFTEKQDCLKQDWSQDGKVERVFCNPPYGTSIPKIVEKAKKEATEKHIQIAILVFVRCDTRWWHNNAPHASEIWFFKGRIKFEHPDMGKTWSATAPSCLMVFDGTEGRNKTTLYKHVDYRNGIFY